MILSDLRSSPIQSVHYIQPLLAYKLSDKLSEYFVDILGCFFTYSRQKVAVGI